MLLVMQQTEGRPQTLKAGWTSARTQLSTRQSAESRDLNQRGQEGSAPAKLAQTHE